MRQLKFLLCVAIVLVAVRCGVAAEHDYAKWEKEIAAFEKSDKENPPSPGGNLFTGSSTIRLWKTLAQDFSGQNVINRGFGGCEIRDCTHFADRIITPYQPSRVLLRAGGNDLWNGRSVADCYSDFQEFVKVVRGKLPQAEIVFISLSPSVARWKQADKEKELNTLIEKYCAEQPKLKYVETYPMVLGTDGKPREELFVADKLHLNEDGYKLLVERVRPFMRSQQPVMRTQQPAMAK